MQVEDPVFKRGCRMDDAGWMNGMITMAEGLILGCIPCALRLMP